RVARPEDVAPARSSTVRERPRSRAQARVPSEGGPGALSRPALASGPRGRAAADVRFRWGARRRPPRRASGGGALLRRPAADGPRREPGRRGDAGEPARAHLPLRLHRRAAEGRGRRPRHRARGARSRGRRGPRGGRRPRAGGRLSVSNETVLTLALLALAIYFSVLVARSVASYLLFLKARPTALLTW